MRGEDFIDRRRYSVFVLGEAAGSRREKEAARGDELAGWYPGTLDGKTIVRRRNGKGVVAFVFEGDDLENDPLILSTLAALRLAGKKDRVNIALAGKDWIEYVTAERGMLVMSTVRARNGSLLLQTSKDRLRVYGDGETLCVYGDENEIPLDGGDLLSFMSLETALGRIGREGVSAAPQKLPAVRVRRRCIAAAAVLSLVCAVIAGRAIVAEEQKRAEAERMTALAESERRREAEEFAVYLASLEAEYNELAKNKTAGVYETLSVLASAISPAVHLVSTEVKDGAFHIEGVCSDALAAFGELEAHGRIGNAVLYQVTYEGGAERFSSGGTVAPVPSAAFSGGELAAFYENALRRLKTEKARSKSAAGAGLAAERLLLLHGARIKSLRYTTAGGAWQIEASATVASEALVRLLEDSEDPRFPLQVTSLSARNKGAGIEVLIVFTAPETEAPKSGFGAGENWQIAALYRTAPAAPVQRPVVESGGTGGMLLSTETAASGTGAGDYLGFIEVEGSGRYTYVKDTVSGEIRRDRER
ncbi:MAG: hypothetical protein LBJ31_10050 [Treponema sp.]|nr:hypothetical protein [Treponema sp.]